MDEQWEKSIKEGEEHEQETGRRMPRVHGMSCRCKHCTEAPPPYHDSDIDPGFPY